MAVVFTVLDWISVQRRTVAAIGDEHTVVLVDLDDTVFSRKRVHAWCGVYLERHPRSKT